MYGAERMHISRNIIKLKNYKSDYKLRAICIYKTCYWYYEVKWEYAIVWYKKIEQKIYLHFWTIFKYVCKNREDKYPNIICSST
jgi:hypothetical protein